MRKILLIPFIFLVVIASVGAQNLTWMEGNWEGRGYQPNLGQNPYWDMELKVSIESGEQIAKIDYPLIPCTGNWKLVSIETNKAEFREIISSGGRCMNNVRLIVSYVDEKHISIKFYGPDDTEVYATATLSRK
jgi:hypothetical protein